MKGGFDKGFGKDPVWWLVLILTLAILSAIELTWKPLHRNFDITREWPWWKRQRKDDGKTAEEFDLEVWQELQRRPDVREKLRRLARDEDADLMVDDVIVEDEHDQMKA